MIPTPSLISMIIVVTIDYMTIMVIRTFMMFMNMSVLAKM